MSISRDNLTPWEGMLRWQSRGKGRPSNVRRCKERHSRGSHSREKLCRGNTCKEKLKGLTRMKEAEICIIWPYRTHMSRNLSFPNQCHIHSPSWSTSSITNHLASRRAPGSLTEELQNLETLPAVALEEGVQNGNGNEVTWCINKKSLKWKEASLRSQREPMRKNWRVSSLNCSNKLKC